MIERESQQAERRRRPALSARSFLFGILALSIAVLSLAAVPSSVASLARNGEAGFTVFVRDAPCVADAHSGDAPPAHSGDHAQCCVICGARDFDGAAVASSMQTGEAVMPRRLFFVPAARPHAARVRPPTGWASSWSSQAPPYFS
jgi:hypothetical protein